MGRHWFYRFLLFFPGMVLSCQLSLFSQDRPISPAGQFQKPADSLIVLRATLIGSDTVPVIELEPYNLIAPRYFRSRSEALSYQRLVHNVRRVYPYARLAGIRLTEYNDELMGMTDAQRRRETRRIEREIRDEFEGDLMRLTRTQGMILIKLIDRQTALTSYNLLLDYRGMISAVFWQSLGRIFGFNLKSSYDPLGEDYLIEEIVQLIDAGIL